MGSWVPAAHGEGTHGSRVLAMLQRMRVACAQDVGHERRALLALRDAHAQRGRRDVDHHALRLPGRSGSRGTVPSQQPATSTAQSRTA